MTGPATRPGTVRVDRAVLETLIEAGQIGLQVDGETLDVARASLLPRWALVTSVRRVAIPKDDPHIAVGWTVDVPAMVAQGWQVFADAGRTYYAVSADKAVLVDLVAT